MFLGQSDVASVITGLTFRTKDDREKDASKTMEIACDVPLTAEIAPLALEHPNLLTELYAQGQFTDNATQYLPKTDLLDVSFRADSRIRLLVKLATSPGGSRPKVTITNAIVKHLAAYKADGGDWMLSFRLAAPMVAAKDAVPFIDALKETVFLTFESMNPTLYDTAVPADVASPGADVTVDPGGVVESVTPSKPKKDKGAGRTPRLVKGDRKSAAAGDDDTGTVN